MSEKIQYGYNAPAKSEGRIKMVRISDIQDNKVLWDTVPYCEIEEEQIADYLLRENDILFARTGGTVGKSYIVSDIPEDAVFAGYLIRTSYSSKLCSQYMKFFMESKLYWKQLRNGTIATAQPNCNAQTLSKMMVPLPPFTEQLRIVETVEKAFEQIDEIDILQVQYSSDLEVLKSKIINAGIQGQLTEQLPEDGTAEELLEQIAKEKKQLIKEKKIKATKALPEITEDEMPFEIPSNWKWVRLDDTGILQTGTTPPKTNPDFFGNDIPFLSPGDIQDNTIVAYNNQGLSNLGIEKARVVDENSVLQVCIGGSIGKAAINDRKVTFNQQINSVTPILCEAKYLFYCMVSSHFMEKIQIASAGAATPIINKSKWGELLIPLPPLAEQRRIIERVAQILEQI